jgi:hypothetical protein
MEKEFKSFPWNKDLYDFENYKTNYKYKND